MVLDGVTLPTYQSHILKNKQKLKNKLPLLSNFIPNQILLLMHTKAKIRKSFIDIDFHPPRKESKWRVQVWTGKCWKCLKLALWKCLPDGFLNRPEVPQSYTKQAGQRPHSSWPATTSCPNPTSTTTSQSTHW